MDTYQSSNNENLEDNTMNFNNIFNIFGVFNDCLKKYQREIAIPSYFIAFFEYAVTLALSYDDFFKPDNADPDTLLIDGQFSPVALMVGTMLGGYAAFGRGRFKYVRDGTNPPDNAPQQALSCGQLFLFPGAILAAALDEGGRIIILSSLVGVDNKFMPVLNSISYLYGYVSSFNEVTKFKESMMFHNAQQAPIDQRAPLLASKEKRAMMSHNAQQANPQQLDEELGRI